MATAQATSMYAVFADEVDVKSLSKDVIALATYLHKPLSNARRENGIDKHGPTLKIVASCIKWDPVRHCWVPC